VRPPGSEQGEASKKNGVPADFKGSNTPDRNQPTEGQRDGLADVADWNDTMVRLRPTSARAADVKKSVMLEREVSAPTGRGKTLAPDGGKSEKPVESQCEKRP